MSAAKKKTDSVLGQKSLVSQEQLRKAQALRGQKGGSVNEALIELGYIDGEEVAKQLAEEYKIPYMNLEEFPPNEALAKLISPAFCRKHNIVPVSTVGSKCLVVACSDPSNIHIKNDLEAVTRKTIQLVTANPLKIKEEINRIYTLKKTNMKSHIQDLEKEEQNYVPTDSSAETLIDSNNSNDGVVIKFVNAILSEAIQTKASDIHIEVYEKKCRVRYRVDGKLQEKLNPPRGTAGAIASRIKIMSKLDIAEKRRPQDGRLKVKRSDGKEVDFRVSVIPVLFGEKIVLRLLDKSNLTADLYQLHLNEAEMEKVVRCIGKPQGMILMTGPTGSGKTTTIYSILNELNHPDTNISTAEDPVEYNVDGINQVQVNSEIGFTFSAALRSFLRQDPDVIMVGEIRDHETAEIAFKAASTGHLVVSTLHTNDSLATITRLVDIGVAPYMVSEVVSLVVAQRLIRKNCKSCSEELRVEDDVLVRLGVASSDLANFKNLQKGQGCRKCNNTGFKGRMPIFEILEMTSTLRKAIINQEPVSRLKEIALKESLITLRQSALSRLRDGFTTVEEVENSSVGDEI